MRMTRGLRLILVGAAVLLGSLAYLPTTATFAAMENKHALKTVVIPVDGMVCVACAATVKKALKSLNGVSNVEVNLEKRIARVTFEADKITLQRMATAIDNAGYKAGSPREVE